MPGQDVLITTDRGLYCPDGGFYIDPWQPVERAVVTHAHGDHLCRGCGSYLCAERGVGVARARLTSPDGTGSAGTGAPSITGLAFGASVGIGAVRVSLIPAGHILGSAQVRVERATVGGRRGETWVVSGDYKVAGKGEPPDPTCEAFEAARCDVFITESTFGLPIYRWAPEAEVFDAINGWWRENAAQGRTSMVFAYALGKAQRILAGIDLSIGPISVHGAVHRMNAVYREAGVALPEAGHAAGEAIG